MFLRLKISKWVCLILLFTGTPSIDAQLLQDTAALNLVRKEIDFIYNMQFNDARALYSSLKDAYPHHPVLSLLNGMITYWQSYPLLKTSPEKASFEEDLHECIKISEKQASPGHQAEYLLSDLCARGFLLLFYSDNNLVMDVIPLTTGTYKYLMRAFDYTSECPDLYYFTGIYNYYRDAYPRAYPVYKPLTMLFPRGDMVTGIKELNQSMVKSVVLRAESLFLLGDIYVNFENNYQKGYIYSMTLYKNYPENPQVISVYLKNLLLLRYYGEAEKLIENLPSEPQNQYLKAQLNIFKGIIQEKKYHDNQSAQNYYRQGILEITPYGDYGNEYAAFGYFGMSRTSEAMGEKKEAHMYRKEAVRLAVFKKQDFDK